MSKVYLKSVILGDGAIGKTSLLWTYENNGVFRNHYIPPSVDDVAYDSEEVRMTFWDTAGGEDYDRLRPLCYPETDVFLLCFSLSCEEYYSYQNIIERWYPEVTLHCPNTPIILVGTKLDLRVLYDSEDVCMAFWDTAGGEDYDRLRPLCYPQTDVFLLCFSLSCEEYYSYQNIMERWYPEVTLHCPNTPIILVGTKLDLRDNEQHLYQRTLFSSLTTEEGMELSEDIGAVRYMECSSLQNKGVTEVIEAAVEVGLKYKK